MAHPDHDQAIGRLVGARLRSAAERRVVSGPAAEAHPDAETWAAYVDGGLRADEVGRLETHLAGCPDCRRLLAALAPEVSSGDRPAAADVEAPAAQRGVVIPFPRRQVFAWMAAAAGLLMAVTLWSVSRLGDWPVSSVAMSVPPAGAAVPPAPAPPAAAASETSASPSRREDDRSRDRVAGQAPSVAPRIAPGQDQDRRKPDARGDALPLRQPAEVAAAEEKHPALAVQAPVGDARNIPLQTNVPPATAPARGPLASQQASQQANQQANQQAGNQQPYARSTTPPPAPAAAAAAPAPEPVAPPAQADAAAVTGERRTNEQLAETVAITSSGAAARRAAARTAPERSQAAGAEREAKALSKDEAKRPAAFGYLASALPSFAEPGGRLQWRIADGLRVESSSDGGTTWNRQYTSRDERLRAGTAPAIDSAWVVGERGLVLRFTVPGGWTAVPRPAAATLIAVSATGVQAARVTADDGRVFETADGGATWTAATPGTGPR